MMKTILSSYVFFLMALLFSSRVVPSEANINLFIGEEEENPFEDPLCSILTCNEDGGLGVVDYFENMWNDLSDISVIFGDDEGGTRRRKLRGQKQN